MVWLTNRNTIKNQCWCQNVKVIWYWILLSLKWPVAACFPVRKAFQMHWPPIGNPVSRSNCDVNFDLAPSVKLNFITDEYLEMRTATLVSHISDQGGRGRSPSNNKTRSRAYTASNGGHHSTTTFSGSQLATTISGGGQCVTILRKTLQCCLQSKLLI